MNIKPTYVTFEQAKLLKEKQFDEECSRFYVKPNCKLFGIDEHGRYYPIKNKPKELWIVGNVAAQNVKNVILAPEQSQVVEWLRIKHNIWVDVSIDQFSKPKNLQWMYSIVFLKDCTYSHSPKSYNSPQEAYSAAFDYILKKNDIKL